MPETEHIFDNYYKRQIWTVLPKMELFLTDA